MKEKKLMLAKQVYNEHRRVYELMAEDLRLGRDNNTGFYVSQSGTAFHHLDNMVKVVEAIPGLSYFIRYDKDENQMEFHIF